MTGFHRFSFVILMASAAHPAFAEDWVIATDYWGNKRYETMTLDRDGAQLSGKIGPLPVAGTATRSGMEITAGERRYKAEVDGDRMTGKVRLPDENDDTKLIERSFAAWRVPARAAAGPRVVDFVPTSWSNLFTADREPVLTLYPGDTVRTKTLDSGGLDETGAARALYGNPQVGPIFIAGAEPGDTLRVTLKRLRLNRPWADSRDQIVSRALPPALAAEAASINRIRKWHLDLEANTGRPEGATGALADLKVSLRPMLGGLAVAPGPGVAAASTGDTGRFGGNMDFNEIVEGATVYLPVQQPGGLLYFGDGHAVQGDGETSQWALETSLDVELKVELVKGGAIDMPLVESATQYMAVGQAGSLDEAVRVATDGLIQWLGRDHRLTLSQVAQVLGTSVKYSITTLAGRNAGIAARLDKTVLNMRRTTN